MSHSQLIRAGVGRPNRSHRSRWRSRAGLGASLFASALALVGAATASAAAGTPTVVSFTAPSRMVQSQASLYWTQNVSNPSSPSPNESFVWRELKTGVPGQEVLLASLTSATPLSLGDIAYTQVGGTWFGYVVANRAGFSQILRVPLTPAPDPTKAAIVLKTSLQPIGQRDLVTDGTNLYWADSTGLREMPIAGGKVTTLAIGTTITHLALDPTHVIYTGLGQLFITSKTVPASGALMSTEIAGAPNGVSISTLSVLIDGSIDELAYGETNGSVFNLSGNAQRWGLPQTDAPPRPGVTVTTVSVFGPVEPSAGWGECTNLGCEINTGGGNVTPVTGSPIDLQNESGQVFWGGADLFTMTVPPVIV